MSINFHVSFMPLEGAVPPDINLTATHNGINVRGSGHCFESAIADAVTRQIERVRQADAAVTGAKNIVIEEQEGLDIERAVLKDLREVTPSTIKEGIFK